MPLNLKQTFKAKARKNIPRFSQEMKTMIFPRKSNFLHEVFDLFFCKFFLEILRRENEKNNYLSNSRVTVFSPVKKNALLKITLFFSPLEIVDFTQSLFSFCPSF